MLPQCSFCHLSTPLFLLIQSALSLSLCDCLLLGFKNFSMECVKKGRSKKVRVKSEAWGRKKHERVHIFEEVRLFDF
jgi:hypothetical protein